MHRIIVCPNKGCLWNKLTKCKKSTNNTINFTRIYVYWTWPSLYLTMVRRHQQAQCWLPSYAWYCLISGLSKCQLLPTILYISQISNMLIDFILVLAGRRTSLRCTHVQCITNFQCASIYRIYICYTPIQCCNRTLPNYQALMFNPIFFQ